MTQQDSEELPPCPTRLSAQSQQLWRVMVPHALDPGRQVLLANALDALDRLEQIRAELAQRGLTIVSATGGVRANPLLRLEKELRGSVANLFCQLGLNLVKTPDGNLLESIFRRS